MDPKNTVTNIDLLKIKHSFKKKLKYTAAVTSTVIIHIFKIQNLQKYSADSYPYINVLPSPPLWVKFAHHTFSYMPMNIFTSNEPKLFLG